MNTHPNSYHGTAGATRTERRAYESAARRQEDVIERHFRAHPTATYTPSEIWQAVLPGALLTSIRRAVTNLTERGVLERTDTQRKGPYGRREHCWRLAGRGEGQGRLW